MMMYDDLVKQLRYCGNAVSCVHCPYWEGCAGSKEDLTEAASAIEELICEVADEHNARLDAEERQRWIPAAERLPKEGETVMTWGKQDIVLLDWLHDNRWCCFGEATYWMPLPEPPKDGE